MPSKEVRPVTARTTETLETFVTEGTSTAVYRGGGKSKKKNYSQKATKESAETSEDANKSRLTKICTCHSLILSA
jgi:hypothetical protein